MKVHVVYDKDGQIISLGVPLPQAYDFSGPKSGAHAMPGQQVAELEIPAEASDLGIIELSKRLHVLTKEKPHRLGVKR
jgi:hypothetical protein